jgi:Flp pilus assembly pilin Flp
MRLSLLSLQRDESGDSLVEYAVLIACLSLAAILAMHAVGGSIFRMFNPTKASMGWLG